MKEATTWRGSEIDHLVSSHCLQASRTFDVGFFLLHPMIEAFRAEQVGAREQHWRPHHHAAEATHELRQFPERAPAVLRYHLLWEDVHAAAPAAKIVGTTG